MGRGLVRMAGGNMTSRAEACSYLGVTIYDSIDTIKKAYREKVKICHPDVNPKLKEQYLCVQKAYEYLITNTTEQSSIYSYTVQPPRPAKIFQSSASAKAQFKRQKQTEMERLKVKQWEQERRWEAQKGNAALEAEYTEQSKSRQEQELLDKIRAIWIVENIKRQIEVEKSRAEEENRKKVYKAFMQQQLNERDASEK